MKKLLFAAAALMIAAPANAGQMLCEVSLRDRQGIERTRTGPGSIDFLSDESIRVRLPYIGTFVLSAYDGGSRAFPFIDQHGTPWAAAAGGGGMMFGSGNLRAICAAR